jgi:hypothetical protein
MRHILVGMPRSGKSTYLAALRHVLASGEVDSKLRLSRLSESEAHLNLLEREWLSCKQLKHTSQAQEQWSVNFIVANKDGAESEIVLPDLDGESFQRPATSGQISKSFLDRLVECDGILLFTNADRGDDDLMIADVEDVVDTLSDDEAQAIDAGVAAATAEKAASAQSHVTAGAHADSEEAGREFDPDEMPEETKLVEFLQLINRLPGTKKRRKIAVVISAWDLAKQQAGGQGPTEWLKINRPMVEQFLRANSDTWDCSIWGVSAQGGSLPAKRAELMAMPQQSERIEIVGPDTTPHDLTVPISWLMDK